MSFHLPAARADRGVGESGAVEGEMSKDQADLDAEEMFGVDCNHTGQSFICEHCVAAELREALKAEAERVTERDIDILRTVPLHRQVWLIDREGAKDAIRAAQDKERE
jgi:hypothetical protein